VNQSEGAKIAATLTALYPHSKLGAGSEDAYAMALADVPYEIVAALMPQIMDAHPTFCPGPAEVRAFVKKIMNPAIPWEEAWAEAFRQVRKVGRWSPPVFTDDALVATVRQLGWDAFCECPTEGRDRAFYQNRFREVYESNARRQGDDDTRRGLPGGGDPELGGGDR